MIRRGTGFGTGRWIRTHRRLRSGLCSCRGRRSRCGGGCSGRVVSFGFCSCCVPHCACAKISKNE